MKPDQIALKSKKSKTEADMLYYKEMDSTC